MRLWVAGLLMSGFLAGCITSSSPPAAGAVGPLSFVAEYDLTFVGDVIPELVGKEPETYLGRLRLELKPAATIADDDGKLRQAYVLESRQAFWLEGEPARSLDELRPTRHYLDGDLLLMRTDRPCSTEQPCEEMRYVGWERREIPEDACARCCEPEGRCGNFTDVSWVVKGAPAPFGLGWQETMRMHLHGKWATVDAIDEDGTLRLPEGTALPLGYDLDPNLEVQVGRDGIPDRFVQRGLVGQGRHGPWTKTARLVDLEQGERLAAIEPWPIGTWDIGPAANKFFPGDDEDAFAMGVTFREGYDELLARSEGARTLFDQLCTLDALVYYGSGYRWGKPLDVLGNGDEVAFHVILFGKTQTGSWEIRYQVNEGLLSAADPPGYGSPESTGAGGGPHGLRCDPATGGILTPRQVLEMIWQLDLAAGVPCSFTARATPWLEAGLPGTRMSGLEMGAWIYEPRDQYDDDPNTPMMMGFGHATVAFDAASGRWSQWIALDEDLRALDSGTLGARPLPTEPRGLLASAPFRCVPPQYEEGPV